MASADSSCSPQSQRSEWKTSPVRHSEWTRTSTSSLPATSPLTIATWCFSSTSERKPIARNSPYSVGSAVSTTRSTSLSWRRRYAIRSATVIILRSCLRQYSSRSGTRAIVPSSFMISQITPAGLSPARRARSTAASVCPVRSSTPPALAFSGKMWPGCTRSRGRVSGSIATWIVWARSAAEMPVVTPSRASIDTVNAVSNGDSFFAAIRSRPSSSQRSGDRARQISPRPSFAMKWIASGVVNCAAIVRSPSFSRSAASQTTTIFPARTSSSASSIVLNGASGTVHQLFYVLGEHVHLQVHHAARGRLSERRALERLGDQRDRKTAVVHAGHCKRHPVDGNRALLHDISKELRGSSHAHDAREALLRNALDAAGAVHVALHHVAAEAVARAQRQLDVHRVAHAERPERRAPQRLVHHVGMERAAVRPHSGEAHAVHRDRVAVLELG